MWLWVLLLVVVIGAIAVLAAGRDDAMVDVYDDRPDALLPTGRLITAADLAAVRLSTAVRGYRMDEVDALLAHVQDQLEALAAHESSPPLVGEELGTPVTKRHVEPLTDPRDADWGHATETPAEPVERPELAADPTVVAEPTPIPRSESP